jgi:hypothetical protein
VDSETTETPLIDLRPDLEPAVLPDPYRRPPGRARTTVRAAVRAAPAALPWLLLLALTGWLQLAVGTSLRDLFFFSGYLVGGVAMPGVLLWRVGRGRPSVSLGRLGPVATDLAVGTAVGYALQVLSYASCAALRLPWLGPAVPPVLTLGGLAIAAVRRRRGRGRRVPALDHPFSGRDGGRHRPRPGAVATRGPVPRGWSWTVCLIGGLLQCWLAQTFFGRVPPVPDDRHLVMTDLMFNLALVGEAKWRWPLEAPWVLGESLHYHWFVAGSIASTGWATGIDSPTLLFRLAPAAFLLVLVLALVELGVRVSGRWWVGPGAAVLCLVASELDPYLLRALQRGLGGTLGALLGPSLWWSPTQTFALVLTVPLLIVVVDAARGAGRISAARTGLLLLLLAAVAAAKGAVLPVVLAGAVGAALLRLVLARRLDRPLVLVAGMTGAALVAAQVVVFGGGRSGLLVQPGGYAEQSAIGQAARAIADDAQLTGRSSVVLTGLAVLAFSAHLLGAAGLASWVRRVDGAVLFLGGTWLAGLGALALLHFDGQSELFFLRAALPAAAVLGAWGLAELAAKLGPVGCGPVVLVTAALLGTAGSVLLARPPDRLYPGRFESERALIDAVAADHLRLLAVPAGLLLLGAVAVAVGRIAGRRPSAVLPVLLAAAALAGTGLFRMPAETVPPAFLGQPEPLLVDRDGGYPTTADIAVLHRLRAASEPGDVLATNAHCANRAPRLPARPIDPARQGCANTSFIIAGYTERRVLVEGWGYTQTLAARADPHDSPSYLPFWDQQRLAVNDAAFLRPSAGTVGELSQRYGVRWLVAVGGSPAADEAIGRVATRRWSADTLTVFEVTG